jgi:UDP-N-acetylglucosamine--N-acetylmuramyl-(pentapeptide) pyrophosphoryl-undecaprenol N-acetylglucosamine transferase
MNILIVSSPTGGHFYPAIEVCKKILPDCNQIVFVIQKNNKFINIIQKEIQNLQKIKFEFITATKFPRKNLLSFPKFLFSFIFSLIETLLILVKYKPELIFSTGGYTSVPVIICSKILFPFIPIIIHEQNYIPSLTTKFLSIIVTKVCTGFETKNNKKFVYTGNPVRENFLLKIEKDEVISKIGFDKNKLTLLIFGGSHGAKSINTAITNFLKENKNLDLQIIHITGQLDFSNVVTKYQTINVKNLVLPYTDKINDFYTIADLVICRAGAMTITELIYFKKPAILIPLPTAAELHQNYNAEFLKKHGCAKVVYQRDNWQNVFYKTLLDLISNPQEIKNMQKKYELIQQPLVSIDTLIKNIYKKTYAKRYKYNNL